LISISKEALLDHCPSFVISNFNLSHLLTHSSRPQGQIDSMMLNNNKRKKIKTQNNKNKKKKPISLAMQIHNKTVRGSILNGKKTDSL
jgi:hypothetical protein